MTHLLRFAHWQERANEVQPEAAYANRTGGMDMEPLSPVRREEVRQAALAPFQLFVPTFSLHLFTTLATRQAAHIWLIKLERY